MSKLCINQHEQINIFMNILNLKVPLLNRIIWLDSKKWNFDEKIFDFDLVDTLNMECV